MRGPKIRYDRLEKEVADRHPPAGNFPKSVQSRPTLEM